jgi:hypothetical protein
MASIDGFPPGGLTVLAVQCDRIHGPDRSKQSSRKQQNAHPTHLWANKPFTSSGRKTDCEALKMDFWTDYYRL